MQINVIRVAETTIEEFADRHGLVMEVSERRMDRWQRSHRLERFTATFKGVEVADAGMLLSVYGSGDTEIDAIRNYAERISSERLVVDAMKSTRREIAVPRLVEKPKADHAVPNPSHNPRPSTRDKSSSFNDLKGKDTPA